MINNSMTIGLCIGFVMVASLFVASLFSWIQTEWSHRRRKGRLIVTISGIRVIDYRGQTRIDGRLNAIHPFKLYAADACVDAGPLYQQIKDVEVG